MDWLGPLVPLIPLALYILWHVIRTIDEARKEAQKAEEQPQQVKVAVEEEKPAPRPRRTANDLDRFLEQTQRRKTVSRANRETAERPAPQRERTSERTQLEEARAAPLATLVAQPVVPMARPVEPASETPAPAVVPTVPRKAAAVTGRVAAMLRDKESLRAAIALQEILGPPVSQRPRRR